MTSARLHTHTHTHALTPLSFYTILVASSSSIVSLCFQQFLSVLISLHGNEIIPPPLLLFFLGLLFVFLLGGWWGTDWNRSWEGKMWLGDRGNLDEFQSLHQNLEVGLLHQDKTLDWRNQLPKASPNLYQGAALTLLLAHSVEFAGFAAFWWMVKKNQSGRGWDILVLSMAHKTLNPMMQHDGIFLLKQKLFKHHAQFLTQDVCEEFVISKPKLR